MSKHEAELPERLSAAGATNLERRLLEAASRERPSADLSERMARGLGIALLPAPTATGSVKAGTSGGTTNAVGASGSSGLIPWISGALVAVGVVVGAYVTTLHSSKPIATPAIPSSSVASSSPALTAPVAAPALTAAPEPAPSVVDEPAPKPPAPQSSRSSRTTTAGELADQIALVDAARSALASGGAQRALSIVREYQTQYPSGTFRPEVAAVKIEALVKLGRTSEARTLAERFVVAYGPSPLAARVARLAQIAEP